MSELGPDDVARALDLLDRAEGDEVDIRVDDLRVIARRESSPAGTPAAVTGDGPQVSVSADEIAEILQLVERSDFAEVRLEWGRFRIVISRRPEEPTTSPRDAVEPPAPTEPFAPAAATSVGDGSISVVAPVVGTFYRGPSPVEPPFVEIGSIVSEDTVLCIIEVMKLMNRVTAGTAGRVEAVHAEDGQLVEYGQPLFAVRPA